MAEYRKAGWRTFYRVVPETGMVTRVINYQKYSEIFFGINWLMSENAVDETKQIPESEFNEQYSLAMERIKNQSV